MPSRENNKSDHRRAARLARKHAHSAAPGAGDDLVGRFMARFRPGRATIVSGYCPIQSEIDSRPLMTALHLAGNRVCVPVIDGPGRPLRFRAWTPDAALVPGPFGAAVPADGDWLEPAVLLVPLLAFDARCFRLGYGGGFYDRTLAGLRARAQVLAIGLAYAAQEVVRVPTEPTDQQLDAVITEAAVRFPAAEPAQ